MEKRPDPEVCVPFSQRAFFVFGLVDEAVVKQNLPAIQPKRLIRTLERAGFSVHRVSGSHYILKHPAKPTLRVTVPFHNGDLKRGTLQSIVKQAGFTNEEFLNLL